MIDNLTDDNFLLYAAQHYSNSCFSDEEFFDDLKKIKYIKRLFNRYRETGDLKERLILNHIIILYNVFGQHATRILFFKLKGYYNYLKPFLLLLSFLPDVVHGVDGLTVYTDEIMMDQTVIDRLREIIKP